MPVPIHAHQFLDRDKLLNLGQQTHSSVLLEKIMEEHYEIDTEGPLKWERSNNTPAEGKLRVHFNPGVCQNGPRVFTNLLQEEQDAKDIWTNVKMILEWGEGTELTKDERESQYTMNLNLPSNQRRNLHVYYVKVHEEAHNDMRNTDGGQMTMAQNEA
ncbi:hypothetical protein Tco_0455737 [Tanacetum coccineum]